VNGGDRRKSLGFFSGERPIGGLMEEKLYCALGESGLVSDVVSDGRVHVYLK
jgi:hypothetical protein